MISHAREATRAPSGSAVERVALEQAAGDHEALDLVRALADDHQRARRGSSARSAARSCSRRRRGCASPRSRSRTRPRSRTASPSRLRRRQRSPACFSARRARSAGAPPGACVRHVGELVLDRLVLRDRLARTSRAPGRTGSRPRTRHAPTPTAAGGDVDAPDLERAEDEVLTAAEALVAAEHAVGRRPGGRRTTISTVSMPLYPSLPMLRETVMPSKVGPGSFSTMKQVMPSSVRAASATMPGALTVGHPRLRAGDHVLVAVARRPAAQSAACRCRRRARRATGTRGARRSRGAAASAAAAPRCRCALIRFAAITCVLSTPDSDIQPAASSSITADVGGQVEAEAAVAPRGS